MRLRALSLAALLADSLIFATLAALQGWLLYGWTPCRGALGDLGIYSATRPALRAAGLRRRG